MKKFMNLDKKVRQTIIGVPIIIGILLIILDMLIDKTIMTYIGIVILLLDLPFIIFHDKAVKKEKADKILQENEKRKSEELATYEKIKKEQINTYKNGLNHDIAIFESMTPKSVFITSMTINALDLLKQFETDELAIENINKKLDFMNSQLKSIPLNKDKGTFVAVDTETTGLDIEKEKIIQLSAVKYENYKKVEEFNTLINPGKHIPENATDINGIDDFDVLNYPKIKSVFPDFIEFIDGYKVVFHNARFDYGIIQNEYFRNYKKVLEFDYEDTMILWRKKYRKLFDKYPPSSKLIDVVNELLTQKDKELYTANAHDGLTDASATALVYMKLIN